MNRRLSFEYLDPSAVLAQESYHKQRGEERPDSHETPGSNKIYTVEEGLAIVDEVGSVALAPTNTRSVVGTARLGAPVMLEDDGESAKSFLDADSNDEMDGNELVDDNCSDEGAFSKQTTDSNNRGDVDSFLAAADAADDDPNEEDSSACKQVTGEGSAVDDEDDVTAIETTASDGSNSHCESGTGRRAALDAGTTQETLLSVPTHADPDHYDSDESSTNFLKESLDDEEQEHCPDRINNTS